MTRFSKEASVTFPKNIISAYLDGTINLPIGKKGYFIPSEKWQVDFPSMSRIDDESLRYLYTKSSNFLSSTSIFHRIDEPFLTG